MVVVAIEANAGITAVTAEVTVAAITETIDKKVDTEPALATEFIPANYWRRVRQSNQM